MLHAVFFYSTHKLRPIASKAVKIAATVITCAFITMTSPYFAAVDLGSNSFHMLIARCINDQVEVIDREKEMVQIARGMRPGKGLDADAKKRALECLARFAERLRDIPKDNIRVIGTKALRAAKSPGQFLRQASEVIGAPIQIISGYEEARLVYLGLANTIVDNRRKRLVIDIGGGSTEFVIGVDHYPKKLESLALGCVTFAERFALLDGDISPKAMKSCYLGACSELEAIRQKYLFYGWDISYGTSGTWKAIAELLREEDGGAVINRASLEKLYQKIVADKGVSSKQVNSLRRSVLPAGVAIARAIFDELKIDTLHVSDATLKDGALYDTLGRLSNRDKRVETVEQLQQQYQIDVEQAERVASMAIAFWKQITGPELPGISRTKILRWAALLHEIGLNISHNGHHHHGYYILRHSDLAGFGRYEQYILANLVRLQRRKMTKEKFADLDEMAIHALLPLVLCLRLSVVLHRRRENISTPPSIRMEDGHYQLLFEPGWLDEHPLTASMLQSESQRFAKIGIHLSIE